ncbi:MAG: glycosyltransferase [Armatimonadota bacterium]
MEYPAPTIAYLRTITDSTGIIQHGVHSVPNRRLGYTTDDNARALIAAAGFYGYTGRREDLDLAVNYLSFLHYSQNPEHKFRNVMTYTGEWLDEEGTDDCYGRSIWACGYTASSSLPENFRIVARKMFDESIVWVGDLTSPRARAYSMVGIFEYLKANPDQADLREKIDALADSLLSLINQYSEKDWHWFESYLTYGNAILPLAMLVAAQITGKKAYRDEARSTLAFFTDTHIINDRLEIIGNDGWYFRGRPRAWYDQQSIDAGYTVLLYVNAYKILGDRAYLDLAKIAYSWFFGNNRSGLWVFDPVSHGCYDAVTPAGVNLNQGAESCICLLMAQLAMDEFVQEEG